jgi:rsbT co-antagonist protein RsbR
MHAISHILENIPMNAPASVINNSASQAQRIGAFIRWALIIATVFSGIDLLMLVANPNTMAVLNVGADVVLIIALLRARTWAKRERISQASWLICGSLWLLAAVLSITDPWIVVAATLLPLLAVISVLAYVEGGTLRWLSVAGIAITVLVYVCATTAPFGSAEPPTGAFAQGIGGLAAVTGLIFFVLNQFHHRLIESLRATQQSNAALREEQSALETQVQARTAQLQKLLASEQERRAETERLLMENALQRATIRQISVPVLPIATHILVMPIIGTVDSDRLQVLQQEALHAAERTNARVVIFDITGVLLVDRLVAQGLVRVIQALQLLGVTPWIVGIRPEVAEALVGLQLDLHSLHTAATLQDILPNLLPTYTSKV